LFQGILTWVRARCLWGLGFPDLALQHLSEAEEKNPALRAQCQKAREVIFTAFGIFH